MLTDLKQAALEPGGGLVSTCEDWAAFTACLLRSGLGVNGARILQPATIDMMASPQTPEHCDRGPMMRLINGRQQEDASCVSSE